MKKPVIGLATFIKLLSLKTEEKIREISKYEKPGGFDRYRFAKDGLRDLIALEKPIDDVIADLPSTDSDFVAANEQVIKDVNDWRDNFGGKGEAVVPSLWRSPNNVFSVAVKPEFALRKGKTRYVTSIYCHGSIRPSPTSVGSAIIVGRQALKDTLERDDVVCVLDTRVRKLFKKPPNLSAAVLESEIRFLEAEFAKARP